MRWVFGSLLLLAAVWPSEALAQRPKATFFLLELSSGLTEAAYDGGDAGLSYGLSGGLTFKLKGQPFRFHVLTSFVARTSNGAGAFEGAPYVTARRDLDLYAALRVALPIWGGLRIYGEAGAGRRWASAEVLRGETLGDLAVQSATTLGIIAAGLQYRLTEHVSIGARAELTPGSRTPDIIAAATGSAATGNRASLQAQLGFHF